jgi:hypothetical protein
MNATIEKWAILTVLIGLAVWSFLMFVGATNLHFFTRH